MEPLPWPGSPARGPSTTRTSASTSSRPATQRPRSFSIRAASPRSTASGIRPTKRSRSCAPFTSRFVSLHRQRQSRSSCRSATQGTPFKISGPRPSIRNEHFVIAQKQRAPAPLITIQKTGEPENRVHFLILGDGYTAAETKKFETDARRMTEVLFATSPFKENLATSTCGRSVHRRLSRGFRGRRPASIATHRSGATYDAFGSERYVLTFDNRALRRAAQFAPYEFIEVLANGRTYGGGGIFNLYSTLRLTMRLETTSSFTSSAIISRLSLTSTTLIRRLRSRGGSRRTMGTQRHSAPGRGSLKWRHLVSPFANVTPIPTPWNKEAFEAYSPRDSKTARATAQRQTT